jgi:hypothetical protein
MNVSNYQAREAARMGYAEILETAENEAAQRRARELRAENIRRTTTAQERAGSQK